MNSPRPDPLIPDHEVLRKIGGGAYGEVWLARGVTGALRAVKVLWREDFEDERSFEREFEGILKFEPISRDHPGMVNILHVGRSPDGKAFYYYVMELGDDVIAGRDINPVEYQARTLRSDTKRAPGRPLDTGFCIDVGVRLAEALRHLHDNGLAHRDVKPANVIFVAGRAKLADIGLVAARGQRTFVGTEGFVPPEGPGSTQADVYSLGKVLYEIATGKDRMEFPELPDEIPAGTERKRWLALNQIICDICEPHLSKRTISTAGDLAEALRRLQEGKRRRRRRPVGAFVALLLVAGVAIYGGWDAIHEMVARSQASPPPAVLEARIRITSVPAEAYVFVESGEGEGELVGTTTTEPIVVHVGEKVSFVLRKEGYEDAPLSFVVPRSAAEETFLKSVDLKVFAPPLPAEPWADQLGQRYRPLTEGPVTGHEAVLPVGEIEWKKYVDAKKPAAVAEFVEIAEGDAKRKIVLTNPGDAQAFCWWLARAGHESGYLTQRHQIEPRMVEGFSAQGISGRAKKEGLKPFRPFVSEIPFGSIALTTDPAGANVSIRIPEEEGEISKGVANGRKIIDELKQGELDVIVWLEGYKRIEKRVKVKANETLEMHLKLEINQSVVMDKAWTNGLEMKFEPVVGGDIHQGELLACIWETRMKDFDAYLRASRDNQNPRAQLFQGPNPEMHPVTSVSREDAQKFCHWLTELERKQERLTEVHHYRLPTDYEWSVMAGLTSELADAAPAKRDREMIAGAQGLPWGVAWPPVINGQNLGNFADSAAMSAPGVTADRMIAGYNDGFPTTSPVGSFPPNALGIYDLSGNVLEWVEENYNSSNLAGPGPVYGVLRGGSWRSYLQRDLYTGYRYTQPMPVAPEDGPKPKETTEDIYGFRIVLAKDRPKQEPSPLNTNGIDDNG
ncbi:SUMF1/EgtB/PvdO family nonheme iron enzyme [Luteolibacter sp. Populi]|uniref:SUMF1/EgtB/PvdO family nonheme iron enzyme n=1 Tax=Luteolibacter sp. Populi TaxID=3230487 RepID=UPI0034666717